MKIAIGVRPFGFFRPTTSLGISREIQNGLNVEKKLAKEQKTLQAQFAKTNITLHLS